MNPADNTTNNYSLNKNYLKLTFLGVGALGAFCVTAAILAKPTTKKIQNLINNNFLIGKHNPRHLLDPKDINKVNKDMNNITYTASSSSDSFSSKSLFDDSNVEIALSPTNPNNKKSIQTIWTAFQVTEVLTGILLEIVFDPKRSNKDTHKCLKELEVILQNNRTTTKSTIELGGILLKHIAELKQRSPEEFKELMEVLREGIEIAKQNPQLMKNTINVAADFSGHLLKMQKSNPDLAHTFTKYFTQMIDELNKNPELVESIAHGSEALVSALKKMEETEPKNFHALTELTKDFIDYSSKNPETVQKIVKVAGTVAGTVKELPKDEQDSLEQAFSEATDWASNNQQEVKKIVQKGSTALKRYNENKKKDPEAAKVLEETAKGLSNIKDKVLEAGVDALFAAARVKVNIKNNNETRNKLQKEQPFAIDSNDHDPTVDNDFDKKSQKQRKEAAQKFYNKLLNDKSDSSKIRSNFFGEGNFGMSEPMDNDVQDHENTNTNTTDSQSQRSTISSSSKSDQNTEELKEKTTKNDGNKVADQTKEKSNNQSWWSRIFSYDQNTEEPKKNTSSREDYSSDDDNDLFGSDDKSNETSSITIDQNAGNVFYSTMTNDFTQSLGSYEGFKQAINEIDLN